MTAETPSVLKTYFETNDRPTQGQFANLIDSYVNVATTSTQTIAGPITVSGSVSLHDALSSNASASFSGTTDFSGTTTLSGTTNLNGTTALSGNSIAVTSGSQSFSGAQKGSVVTLLSSAAHIPVNLSLGNYFTHSMTQNTTLDNPTNITVGQQGVVTIIQNSASANTMAFGSYWKFADGTTPSLSTTLSAVNTLSFYVGTPTYITCVLSKHGVS